MTPPDRSRHPGWTTLFTEARFAFDRSADGWFPEDPSSANLAWRRYGRSVASFRLAARGRSVDHQGSGERLEFDFVPLPYYQGAWRGLVTLPHLFVAVHRVVRSSTLSIVRLPGPVGTIAAFHSTLR